MYTLKEIFDYLDKADKRCLVVIEEFQQITNYPEKNVEATLRTYMFDRPAMSILYLQEVSAG